MPEVEPNHDDFGVERFEEGRVQALIKNIEIADFRFRSTRWRNPDRPASMKAMVLSDPIEALCFDHELICPTAPVHQRRRASAQATVNRAADSAVRGTLVPEV